jgi:hypothetical protein
MYNKRPFLFATAKPENQQSEVGFQPRLSDDSERENEGIDFI